MKITTLALTALILATLAAPLFAEDGDAATLEEMKQEMRALRDRVKELEAKVANDPFAELDQESLDALIDQACTSNVSAPGILKLEIGGQLRVRFEGKSNFDFDEDVGSDPEFGLLRTRIFFDLSVAESLRAYIEIQDSRTFGEEGSVAADTAGVDLYQGYMDIMKLFGHLTIRAGRFTMLYGDQVMISPLDWSNVGRSWDGVKLMWEAEDYLVHFFYTRIDDQLFPDGDEASQDFAGLYGSYRGLEDQVVDLYLLYRRDSNHDRVVGEDGRKGREKLWSLGSRYQGQFGNFDFHAEGGYQFGDYSDDSICAWMFEGRVGYQFQDTAWNPYLNFSWIMASGDDDPNDGRQETWNQLYTFGHYYLGFIDAIGRQNISSPRLRLRLKPDADWSIFADLHYFWILTTRDSLYNAGGVGYRGRMGLSAPDKSVGWELDLHARVKIEEHLNLWFGWCHFFAGGYLEDTGSADDADFVFLQMALDF